MPVAGRTGGPMTLLYGARSCGGTGSCAAAAITAQAFLCNTCSIEADLGCICLPYSSSAFLVPRTYAFCSTQERTGQ